MKKLIIASAILFSTGIATASLAASSIKEKNTLGTADRAGEKNTLGTPGRTAEKNTLDTTYRF